MSIPNAAIVTSVGALMVLYVVRDLFHVVFHPKGRGSLSATLPKLVWRLLGRGSDSWRSLAGRWVSSWSCSPG